MNNPEADLHDWLRIETDGDYMTMDGFDDAIIGVVDVHGTVVVCYDRQKVIKILADQNGWTIDDANEYHNFNQAGAFLGPMTPLFVDVVPPITGR